MEQGLTGGGRNLTRHPPAKHLVGCPTDEKLQRISGGPGLLTNICSRQTTIYHNTEAEHVLAV
jgi:hypothetical protein